MVHLLSDELHFPHPDYANEEGLLAVGGDLSAERLLLAYRKGIFPWFNPNDPPLWWSPDPRFVLFPDRIRITKSMRRILRKEQFEVTFDQAFDQVIKACGNTPRHGQAGTWITPSMLRAYKKLHALGYAHSVEVWHEGELAGGLYGVSIGKCFFGESMFTWVSNASKAALMTLNKALLQRDFWLIDCQMHTQHLERLGAQGLPRKQFLDYLQRNIQEPTIKGSWADMAIPTSQVLEGYQHK